MGLVGWTAPKFRCAYNIILYMVICVIRRWLSCTASYGQYRYRTVLYAPVLLAGEGEIQNRTNHAHQYTEVKTHIYVITEQTSSRCRCTYRYRTVPYGSADLLWSAVWVDKPIWRENSDGREFQSHDFSQDLAWIYRFVRTVPYSSILVEYRAVPYRYVRYGTTVEQSCCVWSI